MFVSGETPGGAVPFPLCIATENATGPLRTGRYQA
jgi:hypothetical protein